MTHKHHDQHDHEEVEFITIYDEEGNEQLYEILFTFESQDYERNYVLLYPAGSVDEEDVELLAFSYEEAADGSTGQLFPIESDEEWDMVEEVLATFIDEEL